MNRFVPVLACAALAFSATTVLAADASQPAARIEGPRVTVAKASRGQVIDRVILTGTLIPRDEILVGPEIEGSRLVEILAEDGDKVAKGQVLARLDRATIDAILAQNDATLARADAAIASAKSQIAQNEASLTQSRQALERTSQLNKSGFASRATYDTQINDERAARARLDAARQGLTSAEADRANAQAPRRELLLRRDRTEVKAPAAGVISRRTAKVGAVASMAAEPLFRIIADGDIELEAEVTETRAGDMKVGQKAKVSVGENTVDGTVRLVGTEIDKATRLGKVRIAIGNDSGLKIGAFARGLVDTKSANGLIVPLSAVLYSTEGPFVQVVREQKIVSTQVKLGIMAQQQVEVVSGLSDGQEYVVRAGAFLRDGDAVTPVMAEGK